MNAELAPGLLVAAPAMSDPRFQRTVILLAEAGEEGALGFVINKASPWTFADIASEIGVAMTDEMSERTVHFGGPVSPERGWVMFREEGAQEPQEGVIEVGKGLRVAATLDVLNRFVASDGSRPFRLLLGYAGWAPAQLESELSQGAWLPLDLDPALIFDVDPDEQYDEAIRRLGLRPGGFVMTGGGAEA